MSKSSMRTLDPRTLGEGYTVAEEHGGGLKGAPMALSAAEELLALVVRIDELPEPRREYQFHPTRKWRFDFAWPAVKFAVEIEGVTHDVGRHQRVDGFNKDLEKYEAAMLAGWLVYRCSTKAVKTGKAMETIRHMLKKLEA